MHLEDSFIQFIEFGSIFDRVTRGYLVYYLKQKINPSCQNTYLQDFTEQELSVEFSYLQQALDQLFETPKVLSTAQEYSTLGNQILEDVIKWLRDTHDKIQKENPYEEEIKEINRWMGKPTFLWVRSWYHLINYLREVYNPSEIPFDFYVEKFETIIQPIDAQALERKEKDYDDELAQLEIIIEDLLALWRSLLTAKRLQYELTQLNKEKESFGEMLSSKVEEFQKLVSIISPFTNDTGRFWDISSGDWKEAGFDILKKYAEVLKNEKSIQALADTLGKMRQAETEIEEEIYEDIVTHKAWVTDYDKKTEIGGIHADNYLPNVLPSEIAYLGLPETESVFLKKYADKNLLSFQYQGKSLVTSNKINHIRQQKIKRKEKGPFIVCIDTSGSMEGTPEQIAKALCFAILKMAAKEHRKAFLINFSIGIKTINLLDLTNSMDQLIRFLTMSFHGGTDVAPALIEAINILQTNDYKEADVLVVSDFVMFDIREDVVKHMKQEQQKDTQFHSLTIANRINLEVTNAFDNNWRYDPDNKEVIKELVRDLQNIA
ncbi:MAG: VWA domain-containing protein [Bacteroidota bacterium]